MSGSDDGRAVAAIGKTGLPGPAADHTPALRAESSIRQDACHGVVRPQRLNQVFGRPSRTEAMTNPERASTRLLTCSSTCRERPAAPFIAKGVEAQGQEPVDDRHMRQLGPLLLASPDPVEELSQAYALHRMDGGRLHQDPAHPARSLLGDVAQMMMLAARVLLGGQTGPRRQLPRREETPDIPDLADHRGGAEQADAGDGHQAPHALVTRKALSHRLAHALDLLAKTGNHPQVDIDPLPRRLW